MKAQELSIGSLVRVNKDVCIKKGTVVEIRQIDADNTFEELELRGCAFCRPLDKEQFGGGVWLDYLDPIPITPEILVKNGFKQDPLNGHIFIFHEKSGEVIYYEYGPKYGLTIDNQLATIQDLKIKYVHELQHALRLCEIEKKINL